MALALKYYKACNALDSEINWKIIYEFLFSINAALKIAFTIE
jgi:hypothetical protein